MHNAILLGKVVEHLDPRGTVVADNFGHGSPTTEEVLEDPLADGPTGFSTECMGFGVALRVHWACAMYLKPPEVGMCMVSAWTWMKTEAGGRGTVGGRRT